MRRHEVRRVRRLRRDPDANSQEIKEMKYFECADVGAVTVDRDALVRRSYREISMRRHRGGAETAAQPCA